MGRTPSRDAPGDVAALERDLRSRLQGDVRFDDGHRALYATDASNYRQVPWGVILPRSSDDVVAAVATCRERGFPVLFRGAGTSLAGQCCNAAVILDTTKHLARVLEVDPARRVARVEPGVVLDRLREAARPHGLDFGPDPATHAWCTVGGMIGNNSCGVRSLATGRTSDNVEGLEVLTYDGLRLGVGPTAADELERRSAEPGREGEIYRGLRELVKLHADRIRERFPRIPRRVSGFNLDELLPENGFHVARALVGTEGTCVAVLEATVRLYPAPPARTLLVLGYEDVCAAAADVPRLLEHEPVGLEGIDGPIVEHARRKATGERATDLLPTGGAWLLVELAGETRAEATERARNAAGGASTGRTVRVCEDEADARGVWEIRESGLGASARIPGIGTTWSGWEDAAVHPGRLADYLGGFRELLGRFGYHAALYGHFGDGCVHSRIDFDLATQPGVRKFRSFLEEAADLVVRHGGSFSGEHGDGQAKAWALPKLYGTEIVDAFRRFAHLWDPEGGMNPGKVVDPDPPEAHLRLAWAGPARETPMRFEMEDDGGSLARATLRCVGVGKCRRADAAFMCPTFPVTGEEMHSTRGRAHLLYEMLRGEVIADGFRSEAVGEALDLCLGCKGCKKECPVDVDLAAYKAEFLYRHHRGRARPRAFYALGLVGVWARVASVAPGLANTLTRGAAGRIVRRLAGIAADRPLPTLAPVPFRRLPRVPGARSNGAAVVLFPDAYNDHFAPDVLAAAERVLVRLGYRVNVPSRPMPAVRAALHYGMLDLAARQLRSVVRSVESSVEAGVPVVVLEPATASVFRDEMRELLPAYGGATRLAESCLTLPELLAEHTADLPTIEREIVLHGHCHQKAVLGMETTHALLDRLGVRRREPEPGCCGMAGSFGLEAAHSGLSRTIGEARLLPAVRAAGSETTIVADGFSCREQIRHGTGRRAVHIAELLDGAIGRRPGS